MKKKNNFLAKLAPSLKEFLRKCLVILKKNPNFIPFAMLIISFVVFSFNLSYISHTTNTLGQNGMGLCEFATMLFSLLSMVCMLNAFPKRKKPNYPMVVILIVFSILITVCDILYANNVYQGILALDPSKPTYVVNAFNFNMAYQTMWIHSILMIITTLSVIFEPVIARLLKKINTSVNLEETNIGSIELSDEE